LAAFLSRKGMNATGWPLQTSLIVYKLFIRPVMKYGIAVDILSPSNIQILQKAETFALRCIFSAWYTTSMNALHKMAKLESFSHRNRELNSRFAGNLHNSQDGSIPAVKIWWDRLHHEKNANSPQLATLTENKIFIEDVKKINHVINRLNRESAEFKCGLSSKKIKDLRLIDISECDKGLTNVSGSILVHDTLKLHNLLEPTLEDQKYKQLIIKWRIGNIATHQKCMRCRNDTELSREHALACSNAHEMLENVYGHHKDPNSELLFIDQLLNKFYLKPPDNQFYKRIFRALKKVVTICLNWKLSSSGIWKEDKSKELRRKRRKEQRIDKRMEKQRQKNDVDTDRNANSINLTKRKRNSSDDEDDKNLVVKKRKKGIG
jgi:hypothetical protein